MSLVSSTNAKCPSVRPRKHQPCHFRPSRMALQETSGTSKEKDKPDTGKEKQEVKIRQDFALAQELDLLEILNMNPRQKE